MQGNSPLIRGNETTLSRPGVQRGERGVNILGECDWPRIRAPAPRSAMSIVDSFTWLFDICLDLRARMALSCAIVAPRIECDHPPLRIKKPRNAMTNLPLSRLGTAIALSLACLLAPMAQAQDAASDQIPAPAAPVDATAPQAPAAGPAPVPATPATDPSATAPEPAPPKPIAEFLPQSMQDALAPILTSPARDPNLPHDLSPMGMFRAADIVVKAVMIGLALASVITWTVLVVKALELWGASATVQGGTRGIQRARAGRSGR